MSRSPEAQSNVKYAYKMKAQAKRVCTILILSLK